MELMDLYDESKNLTGQTIIRESGKKPNIPDGRFINIVLIFIQNSKKEFLFQLTSKEKGSVIATTGGHVKSGQTCYDAILAEVNEELGINIKNENIKHIDCSIFKKVFIDTYYLKKDLDINSLTLQAEEVAAVKWLSIDEINELINQNEIRKNNIEPFKKTINYLNSNKN
ncbi:MAG: NUDIX domain-containing protein [Bacilli bacterium]|nr:NUDIX domain-containing protein [Bacilli bacterium]